MKSALAENSRKSTGNHGQETPRTIDPGGSPMKRTSSVGQADTNSVADNITGRSSNSARGPLHANFLPSSTGHYYTKSNPNEMDSSLPSIPINSIKRQGSSFATNSFHTAHSHQSQHSHTSSTATTGVRWPMDDESQSTMEDGSLQDFFAMDHTLKDDSAESPIRRTSVRQRSSLRESLHSSLSSIRHAATGATTSDPLSRQSRQKNRLGESMSSLPMGDSDHFSESKENGAKRNNTLHKRASVSWARVKSSSHTSSSPYQQHPPPAQPQHHEKLRRPPYQPSYAQPTPSTSATPTNTSSQYSRKSSSKINMLYLVAAGLLIITLVWGAYHQYIHITDTSLTPEQQEHFLVDLLEQKAGVSSERLADPKSDARRAIHWMVHDDPLPTSLSQQQPQSLSPALLQRFSLATFYFAMHPVTTTTGSVWKQEHNWMSDKSVCDWHGVHCELVDASDWFDTAALAGMVLLEDATSDNQKTNVDVKQKQDTQGPLMEVVRIELSNNNMQGTVPPELQFVSQLMSLDLSHNRLTGKLPQDDSLGHFRRLTNLRLEHNQLTGSLPEALGDNLILKELRLDHNSLEGSIPEHMAHNLRNLQHWSLAHNRHLTGTIPTTIAGLRNIQVLELNDNLLTGKLPFGLSQLTTLRTLRLDQNRLVGTIPSCSLTSSKSLHVFNVGNNLLTGHVPDVFDISLPPQRLSQFTVQYNNISGSLPKSLGLLTHLRVLEVAHNKITGFIPREWSYLTKLEILRLQNNRISGTLPTSIGRMVQLREFEFENNLLPPGLPRRIRTHLTKLISHAPVVDTEDKE